jgi:hypothetical protein
MRALRIESPNQTEPFPLARINSGMRQSRGSGLVLDPAPRVVTDT